MHNAIGSMPASEEEKKDEVPASEPEINELSEDVPTEPNDYPSTPVDDVLDDGTTNPKVEEGELDPNGPEPVIEPVNE